MNFYPFHIGDYISHTSHLSDAEDLAYRRLIDLYYQTEAPFPHELTMLARKVKSTTEIVDTLLNEFFEFSDNTWHNTRADREIAKYHAMQDGGRKGAAIRWSKGGDSPPNAKPMPTKNQEPLTKNHIKTITPEGVSDDLWNEFLAYRKRLKAPVTNRITKRLVTEAEKAKMSLTDVLELIMFKGWRSFEASWAQQAEQKSKELPLGTNEQIMYAYEHECGKDPKQARFSSYYDMKQFIVSKREKGINRV